MAARYSRPPSPPRKLVIPDRTSTGTAGYNSYGPYRSRDRSSSLTSPRSSNDGVIPISTETYINGVPIPATKRSNMGYDQYHDSRRYGAASPRRSSIASPSRSTMTRVRPQTVIHNPVATGSDSAARPPPKRDHEDDYYVTPASSAGRERRKIYNADGTSTSQAVDDRGRAQRGADGRSGGRQGYHLSGPISRSPEVDDHGFEYTDARGMYRDTEPRLRRRRGSADVPARERPVSMVETPPLRGNPREGGPPPATRALEKVKAGIGRHSSLRDSTRSHPYQHDRGRNSYDDDYSIPPRAPTGRAEQIYPDRFHSPWSGHDEYDERPEPRRERGRFEDRNVAIRGFGIRSASFDPPVQQDDNIDRRPGYGPEAYDKTPSRRDYSSVSLHEENLRDSDHRDYESNKASEYDRAIDRERDGGRDWAREEPKDRLRAAEDNRRPRGRDHAAEREQDRYIDGRERDRYEDDRRRDREPPKPREPAADRRDTDRDEKWSREDESSAGGGTVAAAAAAATTYGASRALNNRDKNLPRDSRRSDGHDDNYDGRNLDRDREVRDERDDRDRKDRRVREDDAEWTERDADGPRVSEKAHVKDPEPIQYDQTDSLDRRQRSPDGERPRERHYVDKDDRDDRAAAVATQARDPDEDYRERIRQEMERVKQLRSGGEQAMVGSALPREEGQFSDPGRDSGYESRDMRPAAEPYKPISEVQDADLGREKSSAADRYKPREYREHDKRADDRSSDVSADESNALVRTDDHNILDAPLNDEPAQVIENRENRVRIVEPPKEKDLPKSILRKPTTKFPEDPHPIREGVAPLKDAAKKGIPPGARWTKIDRRLVNPDALREAQERFEERQDYVIVLRVLSKEEIQKFADRTKEIRDERYDRDHQPRDRRHRRRDHGGSDESEDA